MPHRALLSLLLAAVAHIAIAQTGLPKSMSGTWSFLSERNIPLNGTMSVVIDQQNPDGTITGRITTSGQMCAMKDEAMTGRFDGNVLTMVATYRPLVPQASCGRARFVLQRSGAGFEGEIPGSPLRTKVSLAPS